MSARTDYAAAVSLARQADRAYRIAAESLRLGRADLEAARAAGADQWVIELAELGVEIRHERAEAAFAACMTAWEVSDDAWDRLGL